MRLSVVRDHCAIRGLMSEPRGSMCYLARQNLETRFGNEEECT